MLEIRNISKTFNPGTVNEKRALRNVNLTLEDCKTVQKRVSREFREGRQRTSVQYYVNSVILPANDVPKGDRKEQEE